jgi:hypothetical protein
MNPSVSHHLLERFLSILLGAATLQYANAHVSGLAGALAVSWIASAAILCAALALLARQWRAAPASERSELIAPWAWAPPWLFLVVMLWQIASYPPMMNDSLCYRLPRIFLWLQEGEIIRSNSSDGRILEMPYGWEILALPLVALNQVTYVALINLAAWMVSLQLFHHWAIASGAGTKQAKWLSLALATAPFHLLQATSSANDLFAAACLLVSVHFILSFSRDPDWLRIYLSLIAFMMACGMKPQFLVLGLGWGAWWLLDSGKPWKHTKLPHLAVFGSLALLVSPLSTFLSNHLATGSFMGSGMETSMESGSFFQKTLIASAQFLSAQLQLPLMPGADRIGESIASIPFLKSGDNPIPFEHGLLMIPVIDWASYGLIHSALLVVGVVLALRHAEPRLRWVIVFALIGFLIAGAKVVPSTIGRSFAGFLAIATPLAIIGLLRLRPRWQTLTCVTGILAGFAAIILNPSSPVWPSGKAEAFAVKSGKAGVAEKLARYNTYRERAATGVHFLDPVPSGERVAILVRGFTPIVGLWTPDWKKHRIEFTHDTPAEEFQASDRNWLLIADNAGEQFPGIIRQYRELDGWSEVSRRQYRPLLSRPPETWTLYHRDRP